MAIPPLDGNISVIETPDGKSYRIRDMVTYATLGEMAAAMREKVDCKTNADSFYGTCTTAAATAAKVVSLNIDTVSGDYAATDDNFSLRPGVRISVKFTNTNTANNPTLNVNSTGAKPIWYSSAAITTSSLNMAGYANRVSSFVYDGTYWVWNGAGVDNNTTYTNMSQTEASAGTVTTGRVISAKVLSDTIDEKIQPLENNISSVREQANWNSNNGVKNICPYNSGATSAGEGTIWNNLPIDIAAGTYSVSFSTDSTTSALVLLAADGVTEVLRKTYRATTVNDTFTISVAAKYIRLYIGASKTVSNFMIRPDFAESTYQPYAKSNSDLTALSAEDRASLVELVDGGAKNLLKNELGSGTKSGLAYTTGTDGSIVITAGTATRGNADFVIPFTPKESGQYVLQGCPSGGSGETYKGQIVLYPSMTNVAEIFDNTSVTATLTGGTQYAYRFRVYNGKSISDSTIYPMVCTKAAWDISQAYVPYAKTNPELTVLTDEDRDALVEIVDGGAKNKLSIGTPTSVPTGLTCVRNNDGTYTVSGTLTAANSISFNISALDGDLVLSGCPAGGGTGTYLLRVTKSGSQVVDSVDTGSGSNAFTMSGTGYALNIRFAAGTYTDVVFKPMICSKSEWDISQEYVPYALPNPELTAAAIEVIDSGTKNLLEHIAFTRTVNDVTYTVNADRSIQISSAGNNTQSLLYLVQNYTGVPAGNYVLSGCTGGSSTTYDLRVKVGNTTYTNYDGGTEFYYNGTDSFESSIVVRASQTVNITMKPMICTKVDWDISQTYQPYRPNITDAVFGPGTEIIGTSEAHQDLNNYTELGVYFCRNSTNAGYVDNKPVGGSGFRLTVENIGGTNTFRQTFIKPADPSKIYVRHYSTSTWSSWYVFEGTAMT